MPGRWDISVQGRLEIFAAKYIASLSIESLLCCALRKAVAAEGSSYDGSRFCNALCGIGAGYCGGFNAPGSQTCGSAQFAGSRDRNADRHLEILD